MTRNYKEQDGTDAPGVISLIFGCLAVLCLVLSCFTCGTFAAVPFAVIGGFVGFFGRGNLRVAGLLLNFLALVPAIIVMTVVGVVGSIGSNADSRSESEKTGEPIEIKKVRTVKEVHRPKQEVKQASTETPEAKTVKAVEDWVNKKDKDKVSEPPIKPSPHPQLIVGRELDEPVPKRYLRVTADQLAREHLQDQDAFFRRYKNRPLHIEGIVEAVGEDDEGKYIRFRLSFSAPDGARCYGLVSQEAQEQAAKLSSGQKCALRVHGILGPEEQGSRGRPKPPKQRTEEDAAAVKLKIAKSLHSDSMSVDGKEGERLERAYIDTLHEIMKKYPMTKAAKEAKKLLDRIGK